MVEGERTDWEMWWIFCSKLSRKKNRKYNIESLPEETMKQTDNWLTILVN